MLWTTTRSRLRLSGGARRCPLSDSVAEMPAAQGLTNGVSSPSNAALNQHMIIDASLSLC
jgi:hypothetical protein